MAQQQRYERQLQALRNDRELARFVVEGRATGKQLGTGSYGSVEEVVVKGLICAGKKIHELLLDAGNVGVRDVCRKYLHECQLMSDLRHPNITQFLGVCFLPDCQLPVLLMERLDSSLDDLLEAVPNIPLALKRSMLEDVSRGLLYLHTHDPQIIHRDLTAKNVLLTSSLVAKITDFGNSRIVNLQPGQLARTLSRLPGTLVYMPPEALSASPRYGPSLDNFSFGHLALFTLTQIFPGDLSEATYPDPSNPEVVIGRTEIERRRNYIDQLEMDLSGERFLPLTQMIKQCLQNSPSRRPTTEQLVADLQRVKNDIEGVYGELSKLDAVRQVVTVKTLKGRESEVREKTNEVLAKEDEIHQLQQQLDESQAENARLVNIQQQKDRELVFKDTQLRQKDEVLETKDAELQQKDQVLRTKDAELQEKDQVLRTKDAELQEKDQVLRRKDAELQEKHEILQTKDAELQRAQEQIHHLQILLQKEGQQLITTSVGQHAKIQAPLLEQETNFTFEWKKAADLPFNMTDYPQAVVINGLVYVGGRITSTTLSVSRDANRIVMVYNSELDIWSTLPPSEWVLFGMAAINNQLVLIGGYNCVSPLEGITGQLRVWDGAWKETFAPMPTARCSPSAVTYMKWLVVVGGRLRAVNAKLSNVEVLHFTLNQWYCCAPLPQPCSSISITATVGNMCYALGGFTTEHEGSTKAFSVCLDDLISQAISLKSQPAVATAPPTPSPWHSLPNTPLAYSTAVCIAGALFAIGGAQGSSLQPGASIYLYRPSRKTWAKLYDVLPRRRERCACVALTDRKILIAGGGYRSREVWVDIAEIKYHNPCRD